MINFNRRLTSICQVQGIAQLFGEIKFNESLSKQTQQIQCQIGLLKKWPILLQESKLYNNYYILNRSFFSTLSSSRSKKILSSQQILSKEQNTQIQQQQKQKHEKQNKIIFQDLQRLIVELQEIHQKNSQNYEKLSATIEKYINEKIFGFYSQSSSDSQSLIYFFQNQNLLQNYSTALNIKSSLEFRFRKYDEILTNIENELYMFKFLKVEDKVQKNRQKLCKMYIFALMFHDHNKLRQILKTDYNKKESIGNNSDKQQQKSGGRKISRRFYEGPKQKSQQNLNEDQNTKKKTSETSLFRAFQFFMKSQNPQCLFSKALAFSVTGQIQKALQTFCQLLNNDRQNKLYLGNFLSVLIFVGNQNFVISEGKDYSSADLKEFVKNSLTKKNYKLSIKSLPKKISPEDAQYLLNSVLSFIKDQPLQWTDLTNIEIKQFSHSIYLIAENYYLNGQKQKANHIIEELKKKVQNKEIKLVSQTQRKGRKIANKSKKDLTQKSQQKSITSQFSNVQMLIKFFQLMRLYDSKDFSRIKELQKTFQIQQKQNFYQFQSIPNDILRSNIYQIFSQTYRELKDNEKADQYQQLSLGNHCVNNSYEINQLEDIDNKIDQKSPQNKGVQNQRNRGIPLHYFSLFEQLKDFQVKFN